MLRTLSIKSAKPKKGRVWIDGDSKVGRAKKKIDGGEVDGDEVKDDEVGKKV